MLIIILYIAALHFYTSSIDKPYDLKIQALVAPLALIPCFMFDSFDVLYMAVHALILNVYCCYYVMD